jgi:hypothetical protein
VTETELSFDFEMVLVLYMVDSETMFSMFHKVCASQVYMLHKGCLVCEYWLLLVRSVLFVLDQ